MQTVMNTDMIPGIVPVPFDANHDVWSHPPIPRVFNRKFEKRHEKPHGVGIPAPDTNNIFNINAWAQYAAYHGHPGHQSWYTGVLVDFAFQVYRPTVFGCQLGCA